MDVHLSDLGVQGSEAEVDIVASTDLADHELGGFLVHISGGSAYPRHEKELLEFMSVSRVAQRFGIGIMVVALDNKMKLEGERNSLDYCSGALAPLETSTKMVRSDKRLSRPSNCHTLLIQLIS